MKQLRLPKLGSKEVDPKTITSLTKGLEDTLNDIDSITTDDIEDVLNYQDDDGGFRPYSGKWEYDSDAGIWATKQPSLLCTLILVGADLLHKPEVNLMAIEKAFNFITTHGVHGHGYDAELDEINSINLLLSNGIKQFLVKHKDRYHKFRDFLSSRIEHYRGLLEKGECTFGWGVDATKDVEKMVDNYDHTYYVAYGSNINKDRMADRCKGASPVSIGVLIGYKLEFDLYLTIIKDMKHITPIVIWKINNEHETNLDGYEGVNYNTYFKEYIRLNVDGVMRYCLVYIMNDLPSRRGVLPEQWYLDTCLKGYEQFNLDKKYMLNAYEEAKRRLNK